MTAPDLAPGERVQAHPVTTAWRQGDRYGTVLGFTRSHHLHDTKMRGVRVKMHSGRARVFRPDNLPDQGTPGRELPWLLPHRIR